MSKQPRHFYEFGPFRLDETERLLLRDGQTVAITPKAFDMLVVLVQNSGHLLDKEELMTALWSDNFVEEANLSYNVFTLRKALGEGNGGQTYVETIPKRGYRFVGQVREVVDDGADLIVEERSEAHLVVEQEEQTSLARQYAAEAEQAIQQKALTASRWESSASKWRLSAVALAALVLVAGLIAALSYFRATSKPNPTVTATRVRSIAVLPFKPLSSDGNDEYLGLGMADTLITKLSSISQIIVRPTSAVRKYTDPGQDPLAAAREQRVDVVLDASIQRSGEKIRVTARLLDVRNGSPLWAYTCDEKCTASIFELQDSISERVAASLVMKLTGEENKLVAKRYTESADAYQLYIMGLYYFDKFEEEGYEKSIEYFKGAIDKDPNYALAYAGLAEAYGLQAVMGALPPAEVWPKSKVLALRALEIDPTLAQAHNAVGLVTMEYDRDWPAAEREFKLAIELNPSYSMPHRLYAIGLSWAGRLDEAIAQRKRAIEIDPRDVATNNEAAMTFYRARQYDQAIKQARMVIEMNPRFERAYDCLGLVYLQEGMYDQAIAEFEHAEGLAELQKEIALYPPSALLGYAYAVSGRTGEARNMLEKLKRLSKQRYVSPYNFALVFTGLGEKDQAFEWLQKACEDRSRQMRIVKLDPLLDSLRADPRYTKLLQCAGLAP
jgi:DNA-binding winged helix-turn-helix (wHTH) protein/TolB-like protein/Tfp pilus assembly protein PilF